MAELKLSRKRSGQLISDVNYMLSSSKVDAVDRTAATELAFAEMISATLPVAGQGIDLANFYRTTLLDGVKDFADQLVEIIQINQEQLLLAIWGAYSYRMSVCTPRDLLDVRPCLDRYKRLLPTRHAGMVDKYPELKNNYWAIGSSIYA